jgi:ornithine carbamoyltransferase
VNIHSSARIDVPATTSTLAAQVPRAASARLLSDLDLTTGEIAALMATAAKVKRSPRQFAHKLAGRSLALLFEKPSLRTRMTFELAMKQLGGESVFTEYNGRRIGDREPVKDVARNLERWVHGIVARTHEQSTIEELSQWASVPVINALSDLYHPCQALADYFTLQEKLGGLRGLKLAFIGDGNNVAHSLMLTGTRLGVDVSIATPPGYEPKPEVFASAQGLAAAAGCCLRLTNDPFAAVEGAHAVYTDVWASMGQENESRKRRRAFASFQVTPKMMAAARPGAVFMHCLPAHRGEEVVEAVIESPSSVVFDQAENRLHVQKTLLLMMLS